MSGKGSHVYATPVEIDKQASDISRRPHAQSVAETDFVALHGEEGFGCGKYGRM
jgi:hypothetical protein